MEQCPVCEAHNLLRGSVCHQFELKCMNHGVYKSSQWIRNAETDVDTLRQFQVMNVGISHIAGNVVMTTEPLCVECLHQVPTPHSMTNDVAWTWTSMSRIDSLLDQLLYCISRAREFDDVYVCHTGAYILTAFHTKAKAVRRKREVTKEELGYDPQTAGLVYAPNADNILQLRTRAISKV